MGRSICEEYVKLRVNAAAGDADRDARRMVSSASETCTGVWSSARLVPAAKQLAIRIAMTRPPRPSGSFMEPRLYSPAIEELRRFQPRGVGVVREDHAAAPHGVDPLPRPRLAQRRAAKAPAEPSIRLRDAGLDVRRAVHHDRAIARVAVEAGLEPVEPQRVAVVPDVGVRRAEQAEARLAALHRI